MTPKFGFRHLWFGIQLLSGLLSVSALGQDKYPGESNLYPWEFDEVSNGLNVGLERGIKIGPDVDSCLSCDSSVTPHRGCSQLADHFCKQLWSEKNKGNIDTPSGRLRYGKSEKSDLSQARKSDLEALVDSLPRLADDLRSKVSLSLLKLRDLMPQEQDSEKWYQSVNDAENEFWAQAKDVARQRVIQAHPDLSQIKEEKLTIEQRALFATALFDIKNEITAAKYQNHPNWLRVVQIFKQAKADLLAEIPKWNLPAATKKHFLAKVNRIELYLPSTDPRTCGSDDTDPNCATTDIDAHYVDEHHSLSVCAGEFNAEQSEAALYGTIAHEMGHSFDSDAATWDSFLESPAGGVVRRLCNARGPVYSCSEWNQLKKSTLTEPRTIPEPTPPLRKLTSCLVSEKGLKAFEYKALRKAAQDEAASDIETVLSERKKSDFARPDLLRAVNDNYVFDERYCDSDSSVYPEILSQELSCNGHSFQAAIRTATSIGVALNERKYSYCGRDCRSLADQKLSRVTYEETADWVSNKLMKVFVERKSTLSSRREAVFTGFAGFCTDPSVVQEKDDHPSDRSRILSEFSPEIRKLVSCDPDQDIENSRAKCDL